jgi:alkyl hydroperoxide reductase subunit AhpC
MIFLLSPQIYSMGLRLGDDAPNFQASSTIGDFDLYSFLGPSWGIIFSHPGAFTPVCTTELGEVARLKDEFDKRNVKVVGLTTDNLGKIQDWIKDINETQQCTVNFPVIADQSHKIASLYGMIHPNASATFTVRSLFIISPNREIKLKITYPSSLGRNFVEILRTIDGLQLASEFPVGMPANWRQGEDVMIMPQVTAEEAISMFPQELKVVKPYLRYTSLKN